MSSADRWMFPFSSAKTEQSKVLRYLGTLAAVTVTGVVGFGLKVLLGFTEPFILFAPVVLVVALLYGPRLGLFSGAVSLLLGWYFLPESNHSFAPTHMHDLVPVLLFALLAAGTSFAGDLFRKRKQRLQELEKAMYGLDEMITVIDRNYRYLTANELFLNYRGMKKQELIGRHVNEILAPGVFESAIKEKLDECFEGRTVQYELRYEYPHCGARDLLITYFPVEGEYGVDRAVCVLKDTTDRRESGRSLRLFRALIDESNDSVFVIDPETLAILDANDRACCELGYRREELLAMKGHEIQLNSDESQSRQWFNELRGGEPLLVNLIYKRRDGSTYPVESSLKYVQLDRSYVISISRDVSERLKAEQAVRESEDRYRDLVEHSEDLVCTHDLQGNLLSVNLAPARALGYEVDELLAIPMQDFIAPEFRSQFELYLEKMRRDGADQGLLCVMTRTGERRIWEYRNSLRTAGVPQPVVRGLAHDITERWRAEQALRQREEDYREFVAQSSEGIFRLDLDPPVPIDLDEDDLANRVFQDSRLAECNDAFVRMYKCESRNESLGKRVQDLLPHDSEAGQLVRDYVRSGFRLLDREWKQTDVQGNVKVFHSTLMGIVKYGKLTQTWGIQRDVTEQVSLENARAEAEVALRKSEEHFRILVEQASDGIYVTDCDGRYLDINTAGAEMLGYTREELRDLSLSDVVADSDVSRMASEIARYSAGTTVRSEWMWRRKDGSLFPGEVCGKQLPGGRLQGILRDLTKRREAEQEMRRNEERFRVALKDSPITVFNQDRNLRYTWIYNAQLYLQQEVLGMSDEEILGPNKSATLTALKRKVLTAGVPVREEMTVQHNGESFAFDLSIEPLSDDKGHVIGITGACMDIARLRELAAKLQDSRDRLEKEKSYLEKEIRSELGFTDIIGKSAALDEVLRKTRIVAPTDSTVLLLGETGTGKELIARSLHSLSARRDKTFVKLNCAAVPSGLLESELFGHEKGAFTGAVSQKVGRIELADKGTLFLDEVGELPPELQPKLLRVLQDREFERLGSVHTLKVDVRIISATNRDLRQDVLDKKFREDLYYRLNVFPIHLPPLRDRTGDIPMLVRHFVEKHTQRMGKHVDTIPEETMRILQNWRWPGNVRELENMIERMIILSKGHVLAAPPAELVSPTYGAPDDLSDMERGHIIRVLRETNGVLAGADGAAVRLGLKRTTLQSMLKRFGIEAAEFRQGEGPGSQN